MIYFDNAATTLKKPTSVIRTMNECMKKYCANSGRGGHAVSMKAGEVIYSCREALSELFGISEPSNIVFTNNTTTALNIAIRGILDESAHIVISGMEHNSVLRPAVAGGASVSFAVPSGLGIITPESVEKAIKPNTRLIAVMHASNVTGVINPIREIGEVAKKHGIPFLTDCAQTAGSVPLDVKRDNVSLLAFAGHKGLYGPTGTGGLYISPDITLKPFITGGTGSVSESSAQPDFLPDRYESGTLNTVGIAGLLEGVRFVRRKGEENIRKKETDVISILYDGLSKLDGIKIYSEAEMSILSFIFDNADSVEIANILDSEFDIAVRGGLHCSALAHHYLGTSASGLVRFSAGYFNTERDAVRAVDAVRKIKRSYF